MKCFGHLDFHEICVRHSLRIHCNKRLALAPSQKLLYTKIFCEANMLKRDGGDGRHEHYDC